jgi:hypothetical protein
VPKWLVLREGGNTETIVLGLVVGEPVETAGDGVAAKVEARAPLVKAARPSAARASLEPSGRLPTASSSVKSPHKPKQVTVLTVSVEIVYSTHTATDDVLQAGP